MNKDTLVATDELVSQVKLRTSPETVRLRDSRAKGRNGLFKVDVAFLYDLAAIDGRIHLDVSAKRRGKSSPLSLQLGPEDALLLAERLQTYAQQILTCHGR